MQIKPNSLGWFDVLSDSGKAYRVRPGNFTHDGSEDSCDCPAGQWGYLCRHVKAVREYAKGFVPETATHRAYSYVPVECPPIQNPRSAESMAELDAMFKESVSSPEATIAFLLEDE